MAEIYSLEISSNISEFPYEKKYPATFTLTDLKAWPSQFDLCAWRCILSVSRCTTALLLVASNVAVQIQKKLELIVGAAAESIQIELHDSEGKFVASLTDGSKTLKELGVRDGEVL